MVITAHQPTFLSGLSVIEKFRVSDAILFLDEVQYSHDGWANRNRMPDGSWLSVPVDRSTDMAAFNRVRIAEHRNWRRKHIRTLWQHYGVSAEPLIAEIERPYRLLIGLNLACLRVILGQAEIGAPWHFQSHLDGGRATIAVSDDREELRPISDRLAMMVAELGGDIYLSGPSGRTYLDERPFHERGIEVRYFAWEGDNPCSAGLLRAPARR